MLFLASVVSTDSQAASLKKFVAHSLFVRVLDSQRGSTLRASACSLGSITMRTSFVVAVHLIFTLQFLKIALTCRLLNSRYT